MFATVHATAARSRRHGTTAVLAVAGAVPALLALLAAWRAPRIHVLLDYWHVLARITDDGGNLLFGQVFAYHLDQPFILPSLLFYADAAWFGGDNRLLTVLSVALVGGIVACLHSMLPKPLPVQGRLALTVGFSWLLFTSHAAEIWLQGTNGISWIPAVFFGALAVSRAHHGRVWTAAIASVLACLSFGAGLPLLFVVAIVFRLRGQRTAALGFAAAGAVVITGWLLTKPVGQQSLATSAFDPDRRLSVVLAALGGLWSGDLAVAAIIAGAITLALLALLSTTLHAEPQASGWIGLGCYSLALAVLIGLGRTSSQVPGGNVGLISRYVVLAALATCALIVLITLYRPQWPLRALVVTVVAVSLATHAIGATKADNTRRGYAPLALTAIALRVDAPAVLNQLHIQRDVIPVARALGAYPFVPEFTLGCHGHELGGSLRTADATDLPGPDAPGDTHGAVATGRITGDALITGWATINAAKPDCILLADATGTITGGGITGLPSTAPGLPDGTTWQATARPGNEPLTVYAEKDHHLYRITSGG